MINISKKHTRVENFLFINYIYFFAVILALISNSSNTNTTPLTSFVKFFKPESSINGFFSMTGGLFIVPLLLFLFGLTVHSQIKSSNIGDFLRFRIRVLGKLFLISAFIIMPLSYYFFESTLMEKNGLWTYITGSYLKTWPIGSAWVFSTVLFFDLIIAALMKYCATFMQGMINTVNSSSTLKLFWSCFIIVFLTFLFTNTSGEAEFGLIANSKKEWTNIGPIWIQKDVLLIYFVMYFLSVLLGSSEKFINYIFAANGELASKWLHRLLEVIILYLAIKFIGPKAPFFDSQLATISIFALLSILIVFMSAASFFSILDRFAYRKSKLLNFFSKHSLTIYAVHFLPLGLTKHYTKGFDVNELQKTYIVVLFTFFISLLLSILIQKICPVYKESK